MAQGNHKSNKKQKKDSNVSREQAEKSKNKAKQAQANKRVRDHQASQNKDSNEQDKDIRNTTSSELIDSSHTKKRKTAVRICLIVGSVCVVLALLWLVVLALTGSFKLQDPTLSLDGVENEIVSRGEDGLISITSDLGTTCTVSTRELDDYLYPHGEGAYIKERFLRPYGVDESELNGPEWRYKQYGKATCEVVIAGQYSADESLEVDIKVNENEGDDDTHTYFQKMDDGTLKLTKTFKIYADMSNQPTGTPEHIILSMTGKKKDSNDPAKEILKYDLTLKTTLNGDDVPFFEDWMAKIDAKIAEDERIAKEKAEQEKENAINSAITPSYADLFRNSEDYRGKYIKITGRVLQTDSTNSYCRIATKKSYGTYYDDVVYVEGCGFTGEKFLEDDIVSIIGKGAGTKTYTSVMGASIELPLLEGEYGALVEGRD